MPAGGLPCVGGDAFDRWAALIRERTGVEIPRERHSFLATGLARRMRATGVVDHEDYYRWLTRGPGAAAEWSALVDLLTVQETRFYRDPRGLGLLRRYCRDGAPREPRALQVLSAGCATGEEAYTLALVLEETLGGGRSYVVTGTDISLGALAVARRGEYPAMRLSRLPRSLRDSGVEPAGEGRGRITERLRRRVCFVQMNLLADDPVTLPPLDVVYCQNVLIYFARRQRERLVRRLADWLRPGGLMILGGGEFLPASLAGLRRVGGGDVLAFSKEAS